MSYPKWPYWYGFATGLATTTFLWAINNGDATIIGLVGASLVVNVAIDVRHIFMKGAA